VRLLAVSHSYPRFDGDIAGAFLERLYVALTARGHTVRVIVPADEGRGGEEIRHGIAVERVRYARPERETLAYRGTMERAVRAPAGAWAFRQLVRALTRAVRARHREANVIHANWWIPAGLAVRRARTPGGPPYVLTLHGTDATLLNRSRAARWLGRPVLRDATRITVVSEFVADIAESAGARLRPVILPMPAMVERFLTGVSSGGGGLVTIGRLSRQKRVHLAVEALAALHAAGNRLRLTIVGDGPERDRLELLVRHHDLTQHVRFTGAMAPEAIPSVLGNADVFVFPAKNEGFGLAAAEALMAGVPIVVATDGGGVLDIARPGSGAELVPPDDPAALAAAIARLCANPGARLAAATAGAEWRARLTPAAVATQLEEMLEVASRQ
jgi:glycosyltransferase involved in cell wall biosynthesis